VDDAAMKVAASFIVNADVASNKIQTRLSMVLAERPAVLT
jgi:hypothetical protein